MNTETPSPNQQVRLVTIDEDNVGQRIDNFLLSKLKGVPKSMIYRIVRKGEVRVNKKRIKPEYKLAEGDQVRIPPVRVSEENYRTAPSANLERVSRLEDRILFEDKHILVLNKPAGIAVHGGSGVDYGVIEALRSLRPQQKFLELVHRLDKDTSGVLLVAKKRSALKHLHDQLRHKQMQKDYQALVRGEWQKHDKVVKAPLLKLTLKSGERIVRVNTEGKASETRFKILQRYDGATLVQASPVTGRTHQIRVHCQYAGHPIACDEKYSEQKFDDSMRALGLNRLFLHAAQLKFIHPDTETEMTVQAPLDPELLELLEKLTRV
ncbi:MULTISPECIES: 23S rRNA pseudouridine(955/2504/2580) synthase RluC [Shewanella]|uniref:23S rRNA pseudouridine(955/2504/2580) synthase RluC n=1 Tax=Shewanella TaxID=22 RepID=UPI00046817FA|nr:MULTISPECIES: 23S rRNA pseudouridine(955/2504/2580) synthase RluC [Shewanella]MBO2577823.1 23S rRNA pseudouridine(955/2504/2580) synthase RluC [Shewanella algae]MBO2684928.1 23S rRNA pseudouridine(955/2504/2580) synthase RluC [Shewanella algae]MDL2193454.1 23S rRNA pseudouridine(955/2504/2580) synthase RluC [Shewanella algae]NKZ40896.1 23S rRNA pseudouridine(955/2504/2580) synthase RluC [Shewanella algae]QTE79827.1 23S rRNA pseudouridine(955/2504/2580) synthase RluC [Shewanella algae]